LRYLLDTNVVSHLVRNPQGPITRKIERLGEGAVCTSIIVAAELNYGAAKRGSSKLTEQLNRVLAALEVCPLQPPADAIYGRIRSDLEAAGQVIGGNDLLLAAHALALDCILVSDNEREFQRVRGLTLENWLR
jgi:tRNA(fMet)-specific endonuclease VapC